MKEFKARAWDILEKRMIDWPSLWQLPVWEVFPTGTPEQRAIDVMLWIGEKDIDGRDIYDGDIVENVDDPDEVMLIKVTSIARGCEPFIEIAWCGWQSAEGYDCRVIGNRYESPEALARASEEERI